MGAGLLVTGDSDIVAPWPEGFAGGEVIGLLRPADVSLSLDPPDGSARNVVQGRVTSISVEGDRARVRLASPTAARRRDHPRISGAARAA